MFKWIQDISKVRVSHLVEERKLESYKAFETASRKLVFILLGIIPGIVIAAFLTVLVPSLSLLWFIVATSPMLLFFYIIVLDELKTKRISKN